MPFIVPSDNQDFDIFMDKTDNFTDKILLIQTVKRDDVGILPYSYPIKWRLSNRSIIVVLEPLKSKFQHNHGHSLRLTQGSAKGKFGLPFVIF